MIYLYDSRATVLEQSVVEVFVMPFTERVDKLVDNNRIHELRRALHQKVGETYNTRLIMVIAPRLSHYPAL